MQRRQVLKGIVSSAAIVAVSKSGIESGAERILPGLFELQTENADPFIINSGIGGNNTVDLLSRIEKDCFAHYPKLTIVMIGTNDMNSVKYVPLEQYQKNLNEIIKGIKEKGSKILLMTILPVYEPYLLTRHPVAFYEPEGPSGRRAEMNDVIRRIADTNNVHLLDVGRRFEIIGNIGTDKDSLIKNEANSNKTDGIHPTSTGYRFIALSVYDYIIDHKLPQNKIVCFGDSITYGNGLMDSYTWYLKKLLKG